MSNVTSASSKAKKGRINVASDDNVFGNNYSGDFWDSVIKESDERYWNTLINNAAP